MESHRKKAVPQFEFGYTIGSQYAAEFFRMYQRQYPVVRNATVLRPYEIKSHKEKYILYQGAVNEGRCFEQLIPAMQHIHAKLIVCGDGNFFEQAIAMAKTYQVSDKIEFKGYVPPNQLIEFTQNAYIGISIFSNTCQSNYLSLANRFFDYMHSAVPQLAMNFPEYASINNEVEIAYLIDKPEPDYIVKGLQKLLSDVEYYLRLQQNCMVARKKYNWQEQEKTLLSVYKKILE